MPKWKFYVERKFNYYIEWVQTECTKSEWQERALGFSFPLENYLILDGTEYFDEDSRGKFDDFLAKKFQADEEFFDKYEKKAKALAISAEKNIKALEEVKDDLGKIDDSTLLELFRQFQDTYFMIFSLAFLRPDEFLEKATRAELLRLPAINEGNLDQVMKAVAIYPNINLEKLDYLEEPIDLLRIANEKKEKGEKLDSPWLKERIEEHAKRFAWMKSPFGFELEETAEGEYLERIKEFGKIDTKLKLKKVQDERITNEFNYKLNLKTFGIKGKGVKLIEHLRMFIYLRTFVTEATDKLYFVARKTLFSEIASRMDYSEADVAALTGDEVEDFLHNKKIIDRKTIEDRKNCFAVVWSCAEAEMFAGEKAKALKRKYEAEFEFAKQTQADSDALVGKGAFRGVVQGRVKIIFSTEDIEKVKKGDVVVTSMTLPAYIAAMEKAAAFVTDEGGITCHAAIIAREMRKPCVIGTEKATEFFEDDDLVEVDGEKGEVRLIEE